jgi:hypothetical protein
MQADGTSETLRPPAPPGEATILWTLLPPLAVAACFLLATLQPFGVSRDWVYYDEFLDAVRGEGLGVARSSRFEPGFLVAAWLLTLVTSSNLAVYGVLASLAMAAKAVVIRTFSRGETAGLLLALGLYLVRFLPLHELTQLRAAMALAALLLAFRWRQEGRWAPAAIACLAAFSLHMSSALAVPFLLPRVTRRGQLLGVAAVAAAAIFLVLGAVISRLAPAVETLAELTAEYFDEMNPLSPFVLLDLGMLACGLLLWDDQTPSMKHVLLLEAVGLAIFYANVDFPPLAARGREVFTVFWVVYVAEAWSRGPRMRVAAAAYCGLAAVGYALVNFLSQDRPMFQ